MEAEESSVQYTAVTPVMYPPAPTKKYFPLGEFEVSLIPLPGSEFHSGVIGSEKTGRWE